MPTQKKAILTRSIRRFLGEPRTARLATIGRDGYPHIVPIWFILDGDDILFATDRDERKVWNARRNPRGAVVIGGDPERDTAGYMIQGDLRVEEEDVGRTTRRLAKRYHAEDEAEAEGWAESESVVLRLEPKKVIRVA